MKLEAIRRVSVGDLGLEIRRQVDDRDCIEGAFLRADTASDAETLGDEGDSRIGGDLDAELSAAHDGAGLLALLTTFLSRMSVHWPSQRYTRLCFRFI